MARNSLVFLTIAYISGVLAASVLEVEPRQALLASAGVFLLAVLLFVFSRRGSGPVLLILFSLLGVLLARPDFEEQGRVFKPFWGHFVTVEGWVSGEPDVRSREVYYRVRPDWLTFGDKRRLVSGNVLIRCTKGGKVYGYGDRVVARGYLSMPDEPGNPGQFDYRMYLLRKGIGAVLSVKDEGDIVTTGTGTGNPLVKLALGIKQRLVRVGENTLPPDQATLLNGIVFGVRGEIDAREKEIFNETGVNHILSVSGLHVGLVLAAVAGLLKLARMPRRCQLPLILTVLVIYAVMTGLSPPVVRSTVMAVVLLLGHYLGREAHWPTGMALAALLVLLFTPAALFDPGFQLSFTATWGILYLSPVLGGLLKKQLPLPPGAALFFAVPLAAQLGTLPLTALHFNLVTAAALPANLLAVPLVGIILPLGAAAALVGQFSMPLAGVLNAATGALLELFRWLVSHIRELPGGYYYITSPAWLLVLAWYPLLWLLGKKVETSGGKSHASPARWAAMVSLSLVLLVSGWWSWRSGENRLKAHFIDVGQGDSIYVQFPNGKGMLVDTGGKKGEFISGKGAGDVVTAYLRRMGINSIDVLVLTHPHEDHAGGARSIVERFPVGTVLVSPSGFPLDGWGGISGDGNNEPGDVPDPSYIDLLSGMIKNGVPVRFPRAGDKLMLDSGVDITFLSPGEPMNDTRSDLNNNSLVIMLNYGRQDILLTGDIEEEAQQWLLDSGNRLACTVLKVPHHGSRYILPEFLEACSPQVTVISVGKYNSFGHPDPETLARLEESPAGIYRTDRDGAVVLSTDGEELWVETGRRK